MPGGSLFAPSRESSSVMMPIAARSLPSARSACARSSAGTSPLRARAPTQVRGGAVSIHGRQDVREIEEQPAVVGMCAEVPLEIRQRLVVATELRERDRHRREEGGLVLALLPRRGDDCAK